VRQRETEGVFGNLGLTRLWSDKAEVAPAKSAVSRKGVAGRESRTAGRGVLPEAEIGIPTLVKSEPIGASERLK
jgi:hypothetical protein